MTFDGLFYEQFVNHIFLEKAGLHVAQTVVLANTRSHQVCWGDWETANGTCISCAKKAVILNAHAINHHEKNTFTSIEFLQLQPKIKTFLML